MKHTLFSVIGALAILLNAAQPPAIHAQGDAPPDVPDSTISALAGPAGAFVNCVESATPAPVPAGLVTARILPSATNPNTSAPDCPHYVAISTVARRQHELFVFLPGTNLEPLQFKMLIHQAALNGYHAIGLAYQNLISENDACSKPLANLPEDPQCSSDFREEVITGVNASSVVTVTQANSIVGRLTALLNYLNLNDPANNWGQYLQNGNLVWSKIRIGGHSQGSGHSALIGTKQAVARVCMFSGPSDNARYGLNPPPSGDYSTIEIPVGPVTVTLYSLPPTWVTSTTATPAQRMFAFSHDDDRPTQPRMKNYQIMGLESIVGRATVDGDLPPYGGAHVLTTTVPTTRPGAGAHNSTVLDDDVPLVAGGLPLFAPVWQYMCFADNPNPEPDPEPCQDRCPDLGDAPDSNNSLGNVMSIHPFGLVPQPAFYPTEYTAAAGTGPIHWNAGSNTNPLGVAGNAIDSALGLDVTPAGNLFSRVSNERNAFLLPDQDVRKRNIIPAPLPANGRSNRDGFDNAFVGPAGNRLPVQLTPCKQGSIRYAQFIHAPWAMNGFYAGPRFINVWVDLNRDGDWADLIVAPCPDSPNATNREWLVQNMPAPAASGVYTLPVNIANIADLTQTAPIWMRISISDSPAPANSIGNGPAAGYRFGETEDHLLCYRPAAGAWANCPALRVHVNEQEADGDIRMDATRDANGFTKPITITDIIDGEALYPVDVTWTIDAEGMRQINPNLAAQAVETTDNRLVIRYTIPSAGSPVPPVVLGWYGCITCTMMMATSAASPSAGVALPPPGTANVRMVDASGFETSEDFVVNIGWRVYAPVVVRKDSE